MTSRETRNDANVRHLAITVFLIAASAGTRSWRIGIFFAPALADQSLERRQPIDDAAAVVAREQP